VARKSAKLPFPKFLQSVPVQSSVPIALKICIRSMLPTGRWRI
jgi:hypothetical protein